MTSYDEQHSQDDEVFTQIQPQITTVTNTNAKFPYLKKGEYDIWAMKMQNHITNSDLPCWNIILNGNSRKKTTKDSNGNIKICPPAVQRETKARTTLLTALPVVHMGDFYHLDDAKEICLAIKATFGGNKESKKMQKSFLKQEFKEFKFTKAEGLHTGYDKFQKILSQMNTLKVRPENEDVNLKFLRALPPSWSQVTLVLKIKGGLKYLSFDDLYNKLKSLEFDVKGYAPKPSSLANAAFVSTARSLPCTFARRGRAKASQDTQRYSAYKTHNAGKKTNDSQALISVDIFINWQDHEDAHADEGALKIYGMIVGMESDPDSERTEYQNKPLMVILYRQRVEQRSDGIFISQDKYVADILRKFDLESVKTATTPYEPQKPKDKNGPDDDVNVHLYRSMIGSLITITYLTASRPDIMFAVSTCSRFQVTPKSSNLSLL
ncbi:hypothetical protein Tco_0842306 [Tanacetum coccineum]|uniref:Uncharacterized protein n=1 Tax=Tanacetum coccineum TaxID=301880 RepID=A0ABQ5B394_9ASTR